MAKKQDLINMALELGIEISTKMSAEELEKLVTEKSKEIKKKEQMAFEELLKKDFDWVSYDEMQKRVAKGEDLKEVHAFDGVKKYGFNKNNGKK